MCVMHHERFGATKTEGTATAVGDPSTVGKKKTKSSQECGKSHSSGVTWGYTGGGESLYLVWSCREDFKRKGDWGIRTKRS